MMRWSIIYWEAGLVHTTVDNCGLDNVHTATPPQFNTYFFGGKCISIKNAKYRKCKKSLISQFSNFFMWSNDDDDNPPDAEYTTCWSQFWAKCFFFRFSFFYARNERAAVGVLILLVYIIGEQFIWNTIKKINSHKMDGHRRLNRVCEIPAHALQLLLKNTKS